MPNTVIVLAMHGSPPSDFPQDELTELFGLHMRLEHRKANAEQRSRLELRYAELDKKVRDWPRTPQNDPFFAASMELADYLSRTSGNRVYAGFNEFCSPTLENAFDTAAASGAEQVIVVTPMMTRGGEHSESDIPAAIDRARQKHPIVKFIYAWPFETAEIAGFLAGHIEKWHREG